MKIPVRLVVLATKFGFVGTASAGVYFLCLFLLRPFVSSTVILTAISYIVSAAFNFVTQASFTFRVSASQASLARFAAMHGLCLITNSALMHIAVDVLKQGLFLSQVAVTAVVAVLSFLMASRWVFRRPQ